MTSLFNSPYNKVLWDIGVIAYLVNSNWVLTHQIHSPILNKNYLYSFDSRRHFIEVAYKLDRNKIFHDMYLKIKSL